MPQAQTTIPIAGWDPEPAPRLVRCHVQLLRPGAQMPVCHHPGEDAGADLFTWGEWTILPNVPFRIPTAIAIAPEPGYWVSIEHRSSTIDRGIEVIQGTIDNGFRGELFVRAINRTDEPIDIAHGERLAQLIPHQVITVDWQQVDHLAQSQRGANGFGSTGRV